MKTFASIDPGLRACGVAIWEDGHLKRAALVRGDYQSKLLAESAMAMSRVVREYLHDYYSIVIELPQTYRGRAEKGDANTLIELGVVCGAISAVNGSVIFVRPHDWKGTIPKKNKEGVNVVRERVREELSEIELARVQLPSRSLEHNVYDAIGIGLWHLKR